jgi:ABC-type transporter Mla MlaB component
MNLGPLSRLLIEGVRHQMWRRHQIGEDILEGDQERHATFVLSGQISRDQTPALCRRLLALMADASLEGRDYVSLEVSNLECDFTAVDALARLHLIAQREGHDIRIRGTSLELRRLIAFAGLLDILPLEAS